MIEIDIREELSKIIRDYSNHPLVRVFAIREYSIFVGLLGNIKNSGKSSIEEDLSNYSKVKLEQYKSYVRDTKKSERDRSIGILSQ